MPAKYFHNASNKMMNFQKPFGFCCNKRSFEHEIRYNRCKARCESCFPETPVDETRPELKIKIQDTGKTVPITPRFAVGVTPKYQKMTEAINYGKTKKPRGPLKWFLEDEIEAATLVLAEMKKNDYIKKHEKHRRSSKTKSPRNSLQKSNVQKEKMKTLKSKTKELYKNKKKLDESSLKD